MNREIKFCGKRIDNGEWVYGTYHYSADGKYHYICAREKFFGTTPYAMLHDKEVWQVDPETVGQFSGLKDRNGKEIYEGDVVKIDWSENKHAEYLGIEIEVFSVEHNNGCFVFNNNTPCYVHLKSYDSDGLPVCEVIGNIHENPELL